MPGGGKKENTRPDRGPIVRPTPVPEEIPGTEFPEDDDGTSVETEMQDVAQGQAQAPPVLAPATPTAPATVAPSMPEPSGATPIQGTFSVPGSRAARPFVTAPQPGQPSIGARIAPFLARDMRRPRTGTATGLNPESFSDLFGESAFASDLARSLSRRSRLTEE